MIYCAMMVLISQYAHIAQLAERFSRKEKVAGSIPAVGSGLKPKDEMSQKGLSFSQVIPSVASPACR